MSPNPLFSIYYNIFNACIISLENNQCDQNEVDNVYESMCGTVKVEMRDKLDSKTITLCSGLSNKRRRIRQPCWTDQISEQWNNVKGRWYKAIDRMRQKIKMEMRVAQTSFNKEV